MNEVNQKIEAIQQWLNELQRNPTLHADNVNLSQIETLLNEILYLIQNDQRLATTVQALTDTPEDLVRRLQAQTVTLIMANNAFQSQIADQQIIEVTLRNAYDDLERQHQVYMTDLSRLNELLLNQIKEHKRVQILEQEERVLTEALRDTIATMSNTLDLDKILDQILDTVGRVTPYDGANVLLVESDLVHVVRQRGYVKKEMEKEWLNQRIPSTKLAILQQLIDIGKPLAISDTTKSPMWIGFPDLDWVNSNVIAPIRSNGKILGFLSLDSATPGYFTQIHAERLQSFADQAAIAIQNARLLDRAKQAAVKAERNRLANELHDTISQTLWSMSLITERLPMIWEHNQEKGRIGLATVHQLAQNALEEMRALLLEMRPTALGNEKLGDLIRQVATIIGKRSGVKVSVNVKNQEIVPPEVHFVLYRAVQESLNNIAHHALASQIDIYFNSVAGRVDLTIQDDGVGFDPDEVNLTRFGLSIMKDRIKNIGGTIETISRKGEGTLIKIIWIALNDENSVE